MGWRGTLRSINAEYKAGQRRALAQHRIELAEMKRADKDHMRAMGALEVEQHEYLLESLQSVHKIDKSTVNWHVALAEPEPAEPKPTRHKTTPAQIKLASYKPSFLVRLFGGEARQKLRLESELDQAKLADQAAHADALKAWTKARDEWSSNAALAESVIVGNQEQQLFVLSTWCDLSDMDDVRCDLSWAEDESGLLRGSVLVAGMDIVPATTLSQLASGKVSEKKMPVGRRNEIYQDYVCGCAIRAATEFFSLIPGEAVAVDVYTDMLNQATGHIEETLILSAYFVGATMDQINLSGVDASECMNNFLHSMQYSKTKGFMPTEPCPVPSS